ncbi:MAG TPA: DNA recombination/repair protein RecA, partial [Protaetiibacter sp.]|nr:DNA recombination/repair protein RecA [Protaetiibacter sp.]
QGKENARNFLIQNPDIANEIEQKILLKLGVGAAAKAAETAEGGNVESIGEKLAARKAAGA